MGLSSLPVAGRVGVADGRNPLLVPNFDKAVASSGQSIDLQSPALFLKNNPRVAATATVTLGGSVTTADEIGLTIANGVLPGGQLTEKYTTAGGDTLSNIAEQLAKAFNDDPVAIAVGLEVDAVGPVLTFNWPGPVGNLAVLSKPAEGPVSITVAGTALTGDRIIALFSGAGVGAPVAIAINPTTGDSATVRGTALKNAINANATLSALGVTATNSAGVVTVVIPDAAQPILISSYVNTISPQAIVIGGTITAGDVLSITFTDASITGSPVVLSYTVKTVDTTGTIAAAFAALINGTAALSTAGISASVSSSTVNVVTPDGIGQLRLTRSATGTETITLPATPTDTSVVATSATETITLAPSSGALSGGSGPILAANNFQWGYNNVVSDFHYGQPYVLGADMISSMVAGGAPIL